jgi:hypothetical protein
VNAAQLTATAVLWRVRSSAAEVRVLIQECVRDPAGQLSRAVQNSIAGAVHEIWA